MRLWSGLGSFAALPFALSLGERAAIAQINAAQVNIAQVNNADLACYLQSEEGRQYDLSALCGGFSAPQTTREATLQTGDVQVTLRWDTDADLDLYVVDPSGDEVSFFNPQVASAGKLDVDANAGCAEKMAAPVENIFWPEGEGILGNYTARVEYFSGCSQAGPVNFTLSILTHGEVQSHTGSVSEAEENASFPFSLSAEPPALPEASELPETPEAASAETEF
ncbi:MAG: hypothetical protein WA901_17295 [Phormidesmis sp.]